MKVILTDKVKSLGSVGEIVNVSEGYARNFLIPNRSAILADESNSKQMGDYQKMLSKKVEAEKAEAEAIAKQLKDVKLTIIKKVGGNGSLFGTVTANELAKALQNQDINVEKRQINIDQAVKTLGEYEIKATLFKGVDATFNISVEIDPKQAEELKKKEEQMAASKKARAERAEAEKAQASSEDAQESEEVEATDA